MAVGCGCKLTTFFDATRDVTAAPHPGHDNDDNDNDDKDYDDDDADHHDDDDTPSSSTRTARPVSALGIRPCVTVRYVSPVRAPSLF